MKQAGFIISFQYIIKNNVANHVLNITSFEEDYTISNLSEDTDYEIVGRPVTTDDNHPLNFKFSVNVKTLSG